MDKLNSRIGVFLYLLLRNDYSWKILSTSDKKIVFEANYSHNNIREDYFDPTLYNQGKSFDSIEKRLDTPRGKLIQYYLRRYKPENVLEIGPGSGFYTKQIIEYPSVKKYVAYDINKNFLEFIHEKLSNFHKKDFSFKIIHEMLNQSSLHDTDSIIMLSTLHHIPDRIDLFNNFSEILSQNGTILTIEPCHYIPRIIKLLKECIIGNYLKKSYRQNRNNLSTHHYCTLGEYKKICKKLKVFKIDFLDFFSITGSIPRTLYNFNNKKSSVIGINRTGGIIGRYFSKELAIVLKKE